ncbi:ZIP zinc transporter-like protein [Phyllosticta citriasiana]|uniref:ZIP zinc transporter-like protein n=1 Tax=Phyllosticta citriasiana TaxID=595635 RepID=A0ABR1KS59_9PEZI
MTEHAHLVAARDTLASWSELPLDMLRRELQRRQDDGERPECGSGIKGSYNTPLHVFALILILVLSVFACSFPIIVRRFPKLPVPHHFLFLSRHFGTGVLIATAFVHLLPTAYTSLTDPCLPPFWNKKYPPMAGLIAMVSVFVVVGIEMFFASRGAGHVHTGDYDTLLDGGEAGEVEHDHHGHSGGAENGSANRRRGSLSFNRLKQQGNWGGSNGNSQRPATIMLNDHTPGETDGLVEGRSPRTPQSAMPPTPRSPSSYDKEDDHRDTASLDLDMEDPFTTTDSAGLLNGAPTHRRSRDSPSASAGPSSHSAGDVAGNGGAATGRLSPSQQQSKALLQCLLLEAGILFHSVFIGMALSVSTGPPFLILLLAISFHQTFEGLALGSRIASLSFPSGSPKPWLMALAYGTTTPLGQAIGLAVHRLYDPASQMGLLMVGIMNAVSTGLLLFAGLVELLAEDFLSDHSYVSLRGRRRAEACGSVVAGAALMALVGAWA